jgi:Glycosyltransferases involved in cell wall biogenesis
MSCVISTMRDIVDTVYCKILKYWIKTELKLQPRRFLYGRRWYEKWIKANEKYDQKDVLKTIEEFSYKPLISIILPVYNPKIEYFIECVESVLSQYYPHWELCIADDCSTDQAVKDALFHYAMKDDRIKVTYRTSNGHISECSNTAIQLASGDYCAFLDQDDLLPPFALFEVVKAINEHPDAVLLFSNEDKLMETTRTQPFFKKYWHHRLLLELNYICHLAVYKKDTLIGVGGLRPGTEGAQDWDLAIRVIFQSPEKVVHIPAVLYHWRMSNGSTSVTEKNKPYVKAAQAKVIRDAKKSGVIKDVR